MIFKKMVNEMVWKETFFICENLERSNARDLRVVSFFFSIIGTGYLIETANYLHSEHCRHHFWNNLCNTAAYYSIDEIYWAQ